jgi:hypothetical protein
MTELFYHFFDTLIFQDISNTSVFHGFIVCHSDRSEPVPSGESCFNQLDASLRSA